MAALVFNDFCIGEAFIISPHKSLKTSAAIIISPHSLDFSRDKKYIFNRTQSIALPIMKHCQQWKRHVLSSTPTYWSSSLKSIYLFYFRTTFSSMRSSRSSMSSNSLAVVRIVKSLQPEPSSGLMDTQMKLQARPSSVGNSNP